MRRTVVVAFAVFACYLVVSAVPVAASHGELAVGSSHDSTSDFEDATSLEGVSVDSGSVAFQPTSFPLGEEDGDLAEYGGGTGAFSVVESPVSEGSHAIAYDSSSTSQAITRPDGPEHGESFSVSTRIGTDERSRIIFGYQDSSNYYFIQIADDNTNLAIWKYNESDSYTRLGVSSVNPPNDEFLRVDVDWETDGTITATLFNSDGEYLSSVSGSDTQFTSGEFGFTTTTSEDTDLDVYWDTSLDRTTGHYLSADHSSSNAVEAWTNLELSNMTATVEWKAYDESIDEWQVVNSAQFSTSGNKTLDISGTDYQKWRVDVQFEKTGANPTAELHSEGILLETDPPEIDDSSLSPNSTETSTGESVTLSADISDSDFGTSYGDSATINWYVDGEQVGSDTTSSSGAFEYTLNNIESGEHSWHVEVEDSYGHRTTSATAQFATPAELRIYDESEPTSLIDGPDETVELRFFFDESQDDLVVERDVEDGTVNMTNLPVDESFIIVADAADYRPRRIWVPSLYETQSVYLLPDSESFVSPKFSLTDYSGRFDPPETVLLIQRPLNGSWETVQADHFGGTNEVPSQLRLNARHRMVLVNTETGERSNRGQYTPLQSTEKTIEVRESGDIDLQDLDPLVRFSPTVGSLPATNESELSVSVFNQSLSLSEWTVTVRYEDDESNETLAEVSRTGPDGGSFSPTLNLSDRAGGTVHVVVTWTTDDGETGRETFTRRVQEPFSNEYSLINVLGNVDTLVPERNVDVFQTMVAVIVSVLVAVTTAAKFRASTESVGMAAVGSVAGFSLVGWVPSSMLFASGVTMVAFAAYRRGL